MKNLKIKTLFVAASVALISTVASADHEARGALSRTNDPGSSVSRAAQVYKNLISEGRVPASLQKNVKCIAVFPNVVTAALAVGGTHGDGVAFCKNTKDANWGNPVFLDLNGGSLGLQAGVKEADVVLYMTADSARNSIKSGSFKLVGDLSAVAGSFEKAYSAPPAGVVAYTAMNGVFAGAAVAGVSITHDKDEQKAFYGTYDQDSIFEGHIPAAVESSVRELRTLLPSS